MSKIIAIGTAVPSYKHKQDDIHDYFMNAETDNLEKALGDGSMSDYSEEEVRMMRIKFMSEYAN